jgi:hypothetical protein
MNQEYRRGISRREFVTSSAALGIVGAVCAPLNSAEVDQEGGKTKESDSSDKSVHPDLQPIVLLPRRTALVVIDMQRYFVQTDYPWGKAVAKFFPDDAPDYFLRLKSVVVPNCKRLQSAFRTAQDKHNLHSFWINDGLDMPRWARKINVLGRESIGQALFPPLELSSG